VKKILIAAAVAVASGIDVLKKNEVISILIVFV